MLRWTLRQAQDGPLRQAQDRPFDRLRMDPFDRLRMDPFDRLRTGPSTTLRTRLRTGPSTSPLRLSSGHASTTLRRDLRTRLRTGPSTTLRRDPFDHAQEGPLRPRSGHGSGQAALSAGSGIDVDGGKGSARQGGRAEPRRVVCAEDLPSARSAGDRSQVAGRDVAVNGSVWW